MTPTRYHFGAFDLDPGARELRRGGEPLAMSPKVFDCIAYLVENRQRAVGRDELFAAIWGSTDVSDRLLGQIVVKARRVLGDTGEVQWAIHTVPRFGYRWVAQVAIEPGEAASPATDTPLPSGPAAPAPARPWHMVWTLAALAAIAAMAAFYMPRRPLPAMGPVASKDATAVTAEAVGPDAAVLPFDVANDAQGGWVRLGAMDYLAGRLRRNGLVIVPATNVVALASHARGADVQAAVREATGATHIVIPSALQAQEGWRVTLRWLSGADAETVVEARGESVLEAVGLAADRLIAVIGRLPAAPPLQVEALPLDELLSRLRAALLVEDLAHARALVGTARPAFREEPRLVLYEAEIDERAGRLSESRARLESLLARTSAESDPVNRAKALNGLGNIAAMRDQPAQAARHYDAALALLAGHVEPSEVARAYLGRGVSRELQGRRDEADADFARARFVYQGLGDTLGLAMTEANQGRLELVRGHPAAAMPLVERAIQRFERLGLDNELPLALGQKIDAHLLMLEPVAALSVAQEHALPDIRGATPPQRYFAYARARALAANGRQSEAHALFDALLSEVAQPGEEAFRAAILAEAAALALASGDAQRAFAQASQAAGALVAPDHAREWATAMVTATRARRALAADAASEQGGWVAPAPLGGSAVVSIQRQLMMAEDLWRARRQAAAVDQFDAALRAALAEGVPADIAAVARSYAGHLIDAGSFEQAAAVAGHASLWAGQDFDCAVLLVRLHQALGQRAAWQAALDDARGLAGERAVPAGLEAPPVVPGGGTRPTSSAVAAADQRGASATLAPR
jgi:DNA-binding winged helix-turn-helix (wHTH) protein/tetratricopeptide (TPR) repeat protein